MVTAAAAWSIASEATNVELGLCRNTGHITVNYFFFYYILAAKRLTLSRNLMTWCFDNQDI